MWSITVNLAVIFALAIVSCGSFFLHSDYSNLKIRCADGYEHVYPSVCNLDCGNSKAFHCKSKESHQCIYRENQCDGIKDCPNGRDESNCPGVLILLKLITYIYQNEVTFVELALFALD